MMFRKMAGFSMLLLALAIGGAFANSEGVIYKDLAWKASDTKTKVKVNGEIILNVCWDAASFTGLTIPGGKSVAEWKKTVKDHVQLYWNGYAGIRFNFTDSNCDVIVGHEDKQLRPDGKFWAPNSRPGKAALTDVANNKPSTTLCWTYSNYNPTLIKQGTYSSNTNKWTYTYDAGYHKVAVLAQAIHEFGHILGLAHEQNHSGTPATCERKMDNGVFEPLGIYDESSIMNYCNDNYARRQYTPSCGDIASARTMYGLNTSENKDPDCINECASGIDMGLAKTGEDLVDCDPPPVNKIIGSMTDYPIRAMLFDTPEETNEPPPGVPRTEPPFLKSTAVLSSSNTWNITFEIKNPNTVMYPNGVKIRTGWYFDPVKNGFTEFFNYPDRKTAPLFPKSFSLPKGPGTPAAPSGLHYTVTQTQPKKVIFSSYEYVTISYSYIWPKPDGIYFWIMPDKERLDLTPRPNSVDFFNAMDANTKAKAKAKAYIRAKIENGARTIAPFYMDKHEVTQRDYMAIMKEYPFRWPGNVDAPAEGMTLYDAILYCNKRSTLEGLMPVYTYASITFDDAGNCTRMTGVTVDGKKSGYRIPTQEEWIHAFRSGTTTDFYWGDLNTSNPLPYGWSLENSGRTPHPVGLKLPNQWGLHDMYGNVKEWTMNSNLGFNTNPYDYQCAMGSDYSWESKNAAGIPMGSYAYNTCGFAGSKWPFIGFRPVRNVPPISAILMLLE